jgi:uncharacterized protein YndB with AHSA1/START domain
MTIEPIRLSTTVRIDAARAFELFTARMGTWWPVEIHSRAAGGYEGEGLKVERVEFQPFVGGLVLEHMSNGVALPWGEVLLFEPPRRFVLAWKPNANANPPTEVEVRFTDGPDGTLVELEHRGWERLGDLAKAGRESYAGGWPTTMSRFHDAAEREVP